MSRVYISNNLGRAGNKVQTRSSVAGWKINARISRNLHPRSVSEPKKVCRVEKNKKVVYN